MGIMVMGCQDRPSRYTGSRSEEDSSRNCVEWGWKDRYSE